MGARVLQVIETDMERRGAGVVDDPIRKVRQYWTFAGELLAEVDPTPPAPARAQHQVGAVVDLRVGDWVRTRNGCIAEVKALDSDDGGTFVTLTDGTDANGLDVDLRDVIEVRRR
jgi:hypothetical protein